MLTDQEKRDLKEMAASKTLRNDFQWLSDSSRALESHLTHEDFVRFLSFMARLCPAPLAPRPFVPYANVRL